MLAESRLCLENLVDEGTYIKIRIHNTKTNTWREFVITEGDIHIGVRFCRNRKKI